MSTLFCQEAYFCEQINSIQKELRINRRVIMTHLLYLYYSNEKHLQDFSCC